MCVRAYARVCVCVQIRYIYNIYILGIYTTDVNNLVHANHSDKFIVQRYFHYLIAITEQRSRRVCFNEDGRTRKLNYAEIDETIFDKQDVLYTRPCGNSTESLVKGKLNSFRNSEFKFLLRRCSQAFCPGYRCNLKTTSRLYCFKKVHARLSMLSRLTFEVKILRSKRAVSRSIRWEPFHPNVDS